MEAYLRNNPPRRSQFKSRGKAKPTGCIVLHTAESMIDLIGEDSGAESVARFIRDRAEPGSYHDLVDSDSGIKVVRYSDAAFQDGTGSNPWALSISWALRASDWSKLTPAKRAAFLHQGAVAFARQQAWLKANGYPLTPLRRISKAQSEAGWAGFIPHGDRDPGRRSDPGVNFPWVEWFAACAAAMRPTPSKPTSPPAPVAPVPTPPEETRMYYLVTDTRDKTFQPQFLTDLLTKRWVRSTTELGEVTSLLGRRVERKVLSGTMLDAIPTVGQEPVKP